MQVSKMAKRAAIAALVLAILFFAAHLFITWRAKQILNYVVQQASRGNYIVNTDKVRFQYRPLSVSASGINLLPVDSSGNNYYSATADSFYLEISSIWSLISQKNFTISSVHIVHPQITVKNKDTAISKKPFNAVLNDIQDALVRSLSSFKVEHCFISNAGITYTRGEGERLPFIINHINLNIDSLHAIQQPDPSDTAVDFNAFVKLVINKPGIQLPDTSIKLNIENLVLDTRKQFFSVNELKITGTNTSGTTDSIVLSNINLKQLNWKRLLKEGLIEIDSLKAFNGATSFDFSDRELFGIKNKNRLKFTRQVKVPLIVHDVEINKIQYSLRTRSDKGPFTIQLDGDSLAVTEVSLSRDSVRPFKIGTLAFKVTNFTNNFDDQGNRSSFDKLIISDNNLELINYRRSLTGDKFGAGNSIFMPSLRVENFSLTDLFQYKLTADKLILDRPSLVIDIQKSKEKKDADESISRILKSLQPNLDIGLLSIREAAIILIPRSSTTGKITIENLSTEIDARQLLAANTLMEVIGSATALSTSGFRVTGDNVNLEVQRSALNDNLDGVYLQRVQGNIGQKVDLNLYGVRISDRNGRFDVTKLQTIELDDVSVDSGTVLIQVDKSKGQLKDQKPAPALRIHNAHTGSVRLQIKAAEKQLGVRNIQLDGSGINIDRGVAEWSSLSIQTGIADWITPGVIIRAGELKVLQPGTIKAKNVSIEPVGVSNINKLFIPAATIQTELKNTAIKKATANKIILDHPVFEMAVSPGVSTENKNISLPDFFVGEMVVNDPEFTISNSAGKHELLFSGEKGGAVLKNISGNKNQNIVTVASLEATLEQPSFKLDSGSWQPGLLSLRSHDISYDGGRRKLTAIVDSARISHLQLKIEERSGIEVDDASGGIAGFHYSSTDSLVASSILKNADWWATAAVLRSTSKNYQLSVFNPFVSSRLSSIRFDSLHFMPLLSRDSFWSSFPFERDYITMKTGAATVHAYQTTGEGKKMQFSAEKLHVENASLLIERDKTRGADTVKYRPLLARSFKQIPLLFSLDTVEISNGFVRNNVIPEKSKQEGNIFFTDMNGALYNVKNHQYNNSDTLRFRIRSRLMGSSDLLVGFRQPYTDSLQTFDLRARMGRMDMSSLNPLLVPLLSVKIERGLADSMLLMVTANDIAAFGSMDLRFHNLRVSLLKKGENEFFLSKFSNWLINLLLRSNDNEKKNLLYQERLQNKAIFNYWAKIAIRGLLTNLGIQRDKKELRKYQKAVKDKKLPDMIDDL